MFRLQATRHRVPERPCLAWLWAAVPARRRAGGVGRARRVSSRCAGCVGGRACMASDELVVLAAPAHCAARRRTVSLPPGADSRRAGCSVTTTSQDMAVVMGGSHRSDSSRRVFVFWSSVS